MLSRKALKFEVGRGESRRMKVAGSLLEEGVKLRMKFVSE